MADAQDNDTKRAKPSLLRRLVKGVVTLSITGAVLAGSAYAVAIGSEELAARAAAVPEPEAAPLIPVTAVPMVAEEGYTVTRRFIGQVEPQKTVDVSFELSGRLEDILVDEGDTVTAGQVLARQDTSLLQSERTRLNASRTALEAQLRFANQTVERNEALTGRGFTTQERLDQALSQRDELTARIAEIDANLLNVDIRADKSEIRARIDGRVTARLVDGGETLAPGQRILSLVETAAPQVRIGVPLDLDPANLQQAQIEVGGGTYDATLVTLRPDIDPVTRTRTALFSLDNSATVAFGDTARLIIQDRVAKPGTWVPTTSLKEGARGQWTILTVDQDDTVRNATVEILHAETDRVFVRGSFPDGTRRIDEGPQRVTVGQKVQPQPLS